MAQFVLEILDGDRAGEVVSLGDAPIRIGRKPQNDLVLADEKTSGVHAEIVPEGGRFVLRDLGSTNGTTMDGRKVSELVLSNGDAFMIGRVRLRFRSEGDDVEVPEGMQVGKIDAARLQSARSSRSIGLMLSLVVVAVGVGGYLWWQGRDGGAAGAGGMGGARAASGPRKPVSVPGNKLSASQAGCEAEDGWEMRVAGTGFGPGGLAHSGEAGFLAQRTAEGDADFAVAAAAAVPVLPGRSVTIVGHLRTFQGGRAAVRGHFFTESSGAGDGTQASFEFRSGSELVEHEEWTRVEFTLPVPTSADRCRIEVVAALPQVESRVLVDDFAFVEGGDPGGETRQKIEGAGALLQTGQAFAIGSIDPEQPVTMHGVEPADVDPALRGLLGSGYLCLSDIGASLRSEADARSCTIAVDGCSAIALLFPADSAGGLMIEAQDDGAEPRFVSTAAATTFETRRALLGDRGNRCLVELETAGQITGLLRNGTFRLQLPAARCRLVLGFRPEREQASQLMRDAQAAADAGHPGTALDAIRELVQKAPHDVEVMSRALLLRTELEEALAASLQRLSEGLDEAAFFETRGGFQRVVQELAALQELYGTQNLPDPAAVATMQEAASTRLSELDERRYGEARARLDAMAKVFEEASKQQLAKLVRDYMATHLK